MGEEKPKAHIDGDLKSLSRQALQDSRRTGSIRLRLSPQVYVPAAKKFREVRRSAVLVTVGSARDLKRVLRAVADAVKAAVERPTRQPPEVGEE